MSVCACTCVYERRGWGRTFPAVSPGKDQRQVFVLLCFLEIFSKFEITRK